jgi:hypothetical protein
MASFDDGALEVLLEPDGAAFEMAPGIVVEFSARRTREDAGAASWH